MSPAAWFALGALSASVVIAAILYVRSFARDAEWWGEELPKLTADNPRWTVTFGGPNDEAAWRGLEDKRPVVKPLYDFDREEKR